LRCLRLGAKGSCDAKKKNYGNRLGQMRDFQGSLLLATRDGIVALKVELHDSAIVHNGRAMLFETVALPRFCLVTS